MVRRLTSVGWAVRTNSTFWLVRASNIVSGLWPWSRRDFRAPPLHRCRTKEEKRNQKKMINKDRSDQLAKKGKKRHFFRKLTKSKTLPTRNICGQGGVACICVKVKRGAALTRNRIVPEGLPPSWPCSAAGFGGGPRPRWQWTRRN